MPEGRISADYENRLIRCNGRLLYTNPPESGVTRRLQAVSIQDYCLYVICSPLLGIGLQNLLERIPASSKIIAIEFDPEINSKIGQQYIPAEIPYFSADSISQLYDEIPAMLKKGIRRVQLINLNGGFRLHQKQYELVRDELLHRMRGLLQNTTTEIHLGRLWIQNCIENFFAASDSALHIQERPEELPIVLLGAGPSLQAALPHLKTLSEFAVIIAVDTALPTLADCPPDVVVVLESQFANMADFIPYRSPESLYVLDTSSFPGLQRILKASKANIDIAWVHTRFADIHLLDRLYGDNELPRMPIIPPMGSVGPAASKIAMQLFSGPLYLAGFDFSYQVEKTHASGTAPDIRQHVLQHRLKISEWYHSASKRSPRTARARNGQLVYTDLVLERYRQSIIHTLNGVSAFTIADQGLDLGIPCCQPQEFLSNLKNTQNQYKKLPRVGSRERKELLFPFLRTQNIKKKSDCLAIAEKSSIKIKRDILAKELHILEDALQQIRHKGYLPEAADYCSFGLPPQSGQEKIDIMIRYYREHWQRILDTV